MRAFVIDAFTDRAFRGNPAGVVLLDAECASAPGAAAWMQDVAAELKHSETAFATTRSDGAEYDLRWFTPAVEVDLCGHATLATTHALHESGSTGPFIFHTRSGALHSSIAADGAITMGFPATPVAVADSPAGLAAALRTEPVSVHRAGTGDLLVELADETTVLALSPDIAALGAIDCRGVIVTAGADRPGHDFVSRFFAPRVGVDEDPVTGSAHCALAPFWARRLGRQSLVGLQLSARGGRVGVEVDGDRVRLRGHAVTVLDGELRV